jgi:hypothetical protein
MRIYGPKDEEVKGEAEKWHTEESSNFYLIKWY